MTADLTLTHDLEACEAVIERGLATFVDVGSALLRIRDERLYRNEYRDFDTYCRVRWGWSRTHADRQVAAAQVVSELAPIGATPTTESQARELVGLPVETAAAVMAQATEATGGKLTAAAIREAREVVTQPDCPTPEPVPDAADTACAHCGSPEVVDTGLCAICAITAGDPDDDDPALTAEECEALADADDVPVEDDDPDPEVSAALTQIIDGDRDAAYLKHFMAALKRVPMVPQFDAERLGRLLSADEIGDIESIVSNLSAWLGRVKSACRPNLTTITGGKR